MTNGDKLLKCLKQEADEEKHGHDLKALCDNCEAECKKNGKVPECWGQYGNPCAKYLDEMERIDKEVTE